MYAILQLARKDLTLLLRNRGARFFVFVWPLITAILFGLVFGGGGGKGQTPVAVSDLDRSAESAQFLADLKAIGVLALDDQTPEAGRELVRSGKRVAAIVLPAGFGAASPPRVELVSDPSRRAEQGMIHGLLEHAAGEAQHRRLAQRDADATPWPPLAIEAQAVVRASAAPRNSFAITFPQGMLWALVGIMMSFAATLVLEQMQGTLIRLRASPMSAAMLLLGKGLGCAIAMSAVLALLVVVSIAGFGVRPDSPALLAIAVLAAVFAFTGIMMTIASLGTTVQTVSGAGWAIMMPLMLFGGGMIPLFAMPDWMRDFGSVSPVKWAILAFEGAIWRGFSPEEMLKPLAILVAVGVVGCAVGARRLSMRSA